MVVRRLYSCSLSSAACTSFSDLLSSADVASVAQPQAGESEISQEISPDSDCDVCLPSWLLTVEEEDGRVLDQGTRNCKRHPHPQNG